MIWAPNAAIWTVQASLRALTAVPSPYEGSARTEEQLGRDAYPPTHQPQPIDDVCFWTDSLYMYRSPTNTLKKEGRINYFSRYGRHNVGLLYTTGKSRKRDNWIWNCFQIRLLMLQSPWNWSITCDIQLRPTTRDPWSRVFSSICWLSRGQRSEFFWSR